MRQMACRKPIISSVENKVKPKKLVYLVGDCYITVETVVQGNSNLNSIKELLSTSILNSHVCTYEGPAGCSLSCFSYLSSGCSF